VSHTWLRGVKEMRSKESKVSWVRPEQAKREDKSKGAFWKDKHSWKNLIFPDGYYLLRSEGRGCDCSFRRKKSRRGGILIYLGAKRALGRAAKDVKGLQRGGGFRVNFWGVEGQKRG